MFGCHQISLQVTDTLCIPVIILCLLTHLPPGENGRHFPDDIFKCIFMNVKVCIRIRISLKFVPKGTIDNILALVQIMAWRRSVNKRQNPWIIWCVSSWCPSLGSGPETHLMFRYIFHFVDISLEWNQFDGHVHTRSWCCHDGVSTTTIAISFAEKKYHVNFTV